MAQEATLEPTAGWMYDLILSIFAPLIDLFFREVQVRGAWRIPSHGSVILVAAPHANQVRAPFSGIVILPTTGDGPHSSWARSRWLTVI